LFVTSASFGADLDGAAAPRSDGAAPYSVYSFAVRAVPFPLSPRGPHQDSLLTPSSDARLLPPLSPLPPFLVFLSHVRFGRPVLSITFRSCLPLATFRPRQNAALSLASFFGFFQLSVRKPGGPADHPVPGPLRAAAVSSAGALLPLFRLPRKRQRRRTFAAVRQAAANPHTRRRRYGAPSIGFSRRDKTCPRPTKTYAVPGKSAHPPNALESAASNGHPYPRQVAPAAAPRGWSRGLRRGASPSTAVHLPPRPLTPGQPTGPPAQQFSGGREEWVRGAQIARPCDLASAATVVACLSFAFPKAENYFC